MAIRGSTHRLLVVDDDPDDVMLIGAAVKRSGIEIQLDTIADGAYLLDYLEGSGAYADAGPSRPDLVLVDLNMPLLDGVSAIAQVKSHHELRAIPLVVLSTSNRNSDVDRAYDAGAASYLTKPNRFDELIAMVELIDSYWFKAAELPNKR